MPWYDWCWNKNPVLAMFRPTTGMAILKIVQESVSERRRMIEEKQGHVNADPVGEGDMLSRFLKIQLTNTSVPPW